MSLFSGFNKVSTVPAGSLAKASLVGANTVKGPGPDSVSTRPAALTAATRVVWSFEFTAFWMMFFDGYIGAPPTLTVFSDIVSAQTGAAAPAAIARTVAAAITAKRLDMMGSIFAIEVVSLRAGGEPPATRERSRGRIEIRPLLMGVSPALSRLRE